MPRKEDALKKIAKKRMGEMFGEKGDFRGLNAFFPKSKPDKNKDTLTKMTGVVKKDTVAKMTTVSKLAGVPNLDAVLQKLAAAVKSTPQLVYLKLYSLSHGQNRTVTDWLGYGEIAQVCNISSSTARRAIRALVSKGLIERTELKNEKEIKGSTYKVNLPL